MFLLLILCKIPFNTITCNPTCPPDPQPRQNAEWYDPHPISITAVSCLLTVTPPQSSPGIWWPNCPQRVRVPSCEKVTWPPRAVLTRARCLCYYCSDYMPELSQTLGKSALLLWSVDNTIKRLVLEFATLISENVQIKIAAWILWAMNVSRVNWGLKVFCNCLNSWVV